jgi:hypothetical protein
MERMMLVLEPDAARQQALAALLEAQQDRQSAQFQQWLTPVEFGRQFGVSEDDVERVVGWLEARGFEVEPPAEGRRTVVFSGTAGQVRSAFRTEIHTYRVQGEPHYANASEPEILRRWRTWWAGLPPYDRWLALYGDDQRGGLGMDVHEQRLVAYRHRGRPRRGHRDGQGSRQSHASERAAVLTIAGSAVTVTEPGKR